MAKQNPVDTQEQWKPEVKKYGGYLIRQVNEDTFEIYTKEEWYYGEGCRTPEWEACSLGEAKEWIDGE